MSDELIIGTPDDASGGERRRAPRQEYDCLVLIAHGDAGYLGQMDNVSSTGCRVTRPEDWALADGTDVKLYLIIDQRHVFCAAARVVWSNDRAIGFHYSEPQTLPG